MDSKLLISFPFHVPQAFSPIVVALPVYSLCRHILPLKLCLTPLSSQAQLKHHLLQTHLDSDHPLLGLGVCPLYFLGIMWIYLWHCTTDNANTSDSNIIEAACVFHNLPNTVQALHNMTSASLTKLYHLILLFPFHSWWPWGQRDWIPCGSPYS